MGRMVACSSSLLFFVVLLNLGLLLTADPSPPAAPQYTEDGKLVAPAHYREWVYLSSGLGMTYGARASRDPEKRLFDNVFVNPDGYQGFMKTGLWPDRTVFVLEIRDSENHGSINRDGHFQRGLAGMEIEVKDRAARPGVWTFYDFPIRSGKPAAEAGPIPHEAACYTCHATNTAVENTFVQFYPTLFEVAKAKGTLNPAFVKSLADGGPL